MKFLFSIFLLSIAVLADAQEKSSFKKGIRFSVDFTPLLMAFNPERVGLGGAVDYEFKENLFAVVEGGWLDYNSNHSAYSYQLNGMYGLLGVDYNLLKQEIRVDDDIFFVGLRYGASKFKHQTDNITYTNYWGTYQESYEQQQLFRQWAEITFGFKAELYFAKNVFIGWTLRAKILISGKKNDILQPYVIPGYGKTEKGFKFGLSWFLAYKIPFGEK